jgi:hypothetical protein
MRFCFPIFMIFQKKVHYLINKKEWSAENVLIYKDIEKYKSIKEFDKRIDLAKEIEKNYLSFTLSPMEINIDEKAIYSYKKNLNSYKNNYINLKIEIEIKDDELFTEIRPAVINNMHDTFLRFKHTHTYIQFKKDYKIMKGKI